MSLRTVTRVALALAVAFAAALAAAVVRQDVSWPLMLAGGAGILVCATALPIAALRWLRPPTSAYILRTGRSLGRPVVREWVDIEQVARVMWLAAIATEDAFFKHHSGFDWQSIREAHAHNRTHAHKRGASTITQQLAKNLFLSPSRSYARKLVEAYLTMLMEALWPKRRILEVYLNVVQFDADLFGVEAAARRFFSKAARDLNEHESALLAAALRGPLLYKVSRPSHVLRFRQSWVLSSMRRLGDAYAEHL